MILHQRPLRTIYNLLSLTNSILLIADTVLVLHKSCSQLMIFISLPIEKIIVRCSYCAPFVPPNLLHTHTKYNLYLANSLAAALSEPALCRLLTFYVPNKMSLSFAWCVMPPLGTPPSPKIRVVKYFTSGVFCLQWECLAYEYFLTFFSRVGIVSASPNPHTGGPPLFRLSATAFSIYSQLPSLSEAVPPTAS